MVAAYKAVGTIATTTGTSIAVPVTAAVAAGDYAVIDLFLGAQTTAPTTPTNWTLAYSDVNGAGGSRHVYYRAFTGTVSAGNATFTITAGGAYGKSVMHSGAGTGAPTVLSSKIDSAAAYWQSAAITTAYPRAAAHFGFINAVRTQGSLSNQGTITSTNTSRGSNDSILSAYCLHTATSAITSSAGGSVRGAFSGGSQTSWTLTVLIPEAPPAAPTGLSVTGGARELDVTFDAVSGADSYVVEWRRTDLTAPSLSTQTSAPWSLDRLDDATGLDTTYTYTWNGSGKRVYAVDSGVRGTHNEFTGRLRTGTAIGGGSTADVNGHGTQVASAAVGTTYGTAKGATLVPVRMYAGSETSYLDTDWDAFDTLVAWIIADAAGEHHVVSFSGFYPRNGQTHYAQVTAAMQSLITAGLTVVMAAGNENTSIDLGTGYAGCIVVGGTTNTDARWDDSPGFGSVWSTGITLWAPADDVPLAFSSSDSANGTASGTSFAQPLTAGVAAKILHANPALSPPRVKEVLESQARSGILTGITAGPNLLLNGNAQTSDWSRHPVASTTITLDGLDDAAAYEIRVRTVDNGVESAASATDSATTVSAVAGTLTAALPKVTGSLSGISVNAATMVAVAPKLTGSLAGASVNLGSLSATTPSVVGTVAGDSTNPAALTATVPVVVGAISGASVNGGGVSGQTPQLTGSVSGASVNLGGISGVLPIVTSDLADQPSISGSISGTLPVLVGSLSGALVNAGTLSATLPATAGAVAGVQVNAGMLGGSTPNVTGAVTGSMVNTAELDGILPVVVASLADTSTNPGTLAATLPAVEGSVSGQSVNRGALNATAPALSGTIQATLTNPGTVTATLPPMTGQITALLVVYAVLAGVLPRLTCSITDTVFAPFPVVGTLVLTGPSRSLTLAGPSRTLALTGPVRTLEWS